MTDPLPKVTVDHAQLRFLAGMTEATIRLGYGATHVENSHLMEILRLAGVGLDFEAACNGVPR